MNDFLKLFAQALETDVSKLSMDMPLERLDDWDSLAMVSFVALADRHYHKSIAGAAVAKARTVRDLYDLVEPKETQ
jgi:acyl carrier protein